MKIITRFEDMSATGYLRIIQNDDGDIDVEICEECDISPQSVEFCNSGTRSPATYFALIALANAMREDEGRRPS